MLFRYFENNEKNMQKIKITNKTEIKTHFIKIFNKSF